MTETPTIVRPEIEQVTVPLDTDTGDHDTFSHYVKIWARIEGGECVALCGKRWIPKSKNPEKYPVCPDCKRIYDQPQGPPL